MEQELVPAEPSQTYPALPSYITRKTKKERLNYFLVAPFLVRIAWYVSVPFSRRNDAKKIFPVLAYFMLDLYICNFVFHHIVTIVNV